MTRRRRPVVPGPPPGAEVLAPTVTVLTNSLTPWLRSRFTLREDGLHADVPRTVLGLVPCGRRRVRMPLDRIAAARVAMGLRPGRAVVCLVLLAVALVVVTGPLRLVPLTVGLWLIPLSYVAMLEVAVRDARRERFPICVFARLDVRLVVAATRLEIAARDLGETVDAADTGDAADDGDAADAAGEERIR
jgi:hypothetical protein